jgi:hypothetical protein
MKKGAELSSTLKPHTDKEKGKGKGTSSSLEPT